MSIEFFTQKAAKAALAAKDAKLADLKNQLATRKPLLTALAAFHDKNGRQPEGPELIELYDKVMPHSKSAASKPAPPTPAKTAAASTTPKVVATVPIL